jgi:hypothetical protein
MLYFHPELFPFTLKFMHWYNGLIIWMFYSSPFLYALFSLLLSKYCVTKPQNTDIPSVCHWHHCVDTFNVGNVSGCPYHYPLLWWFHHQCWLGVDCSSLCVWVSVFCNIWGFHSHVTENVTCCQLVDSCWCCSGSQCLCVWDQAFQEEVWPDWHCRQRSCSPMKCQ